MASKLTVADYFAHFIADKKVPAVYELSGGMIAFLTDSIFRLGKTKIINTRHEQAAGFAAESATRVSGIPNVAMGTSGPGATNLITAIGSAFFDSSPTIFITGQVHTQEIRSNPMQRQNGFQELDIISATRSITKYATQVISSNSFPAILSQAWDIAISGRPGPVLIDIPIDIQQDFCQFPSARENATESKVTTDHHKFEILLKSLNKAKLPLILAGGGVRSSDTVKEILNLIDLTQIPVVHTLMGKDILPTSHALNLGFIGSYGNRWANRALSRADLLLVLGSRLDVRQTGSDLEDFTKDKYIVRVDVDQYELEGRVSAQLNFSMDLKEFLINLLGLELPRVNSQEMLQRVGSERSVFTSDSEQMILLPLSPDTCLKWISKLSKGVAGFCVDVGQHQMWAAQSIGIDPGQRFLTSGGMGAMGFAVPAAIGAATASNDRWFAITGDGCLQLSSSELQTIAHYKLPIVIFVLNNHQHGMVAQFQEENMEGRYVSTRIGYSTPDFCSVGDAYGIKTIKVTKESDFQTVEDLLQNSPTDPLLVEIVIDNQAKALPKIDRFTKLSSL
jgi:acetolactate synthase-1/2/3 large subunit